MEELVAKELPAEFGEFLRDTGRLPPEAMTYLPAREVPEPDQRLLVHPHDMTSTLAAFHGSALRVEILQRRRIGDYYLREVFLRTQNTARIVEYGLIAIVLGQFTPPQQAEILTGRLPLGGLLHRYQIPFASAPICFFSVATGGLEQTHRTALNHATCYGRFNRLSKRTGEPLAWIMEILPHTPPERAGRLEIENT